ncbi:leucine-rich repeat domain-containing protein [Skeletonema marinoi]|uniref:Leucine-rich repeat domain-containing protein n=1 Tax=Skeletonema marinoi TaxID=267567 RepID=A0AAD8XVJ8_9STRA|nr:leucine-rich repeat domain-containing protein [Skeletonema marinoi]
MAADGWYTYTGREGEIIPRNATRVRIDESLTVIPAWAFYGNRNIEEVECHDRVKTVGEEAFSNCTSLRLIIMSGVKVVECEAFSCCYALAYVECDKLEIIRHHAFLDCESLTSINLPSAKIIKEDAFLDCHALTNVVFGKELESIKECAFFRCTSLERITIPLKDNMITDDDIFEGCNLLHVDLVEGELHESIDALLWEEWKNDMNEEINSINQILPTTPAGAGDAVVDMGGKALAIRMWIRSVLRKIIQYKAQHFSVLEEAAARLKLALPQDIVIKNVIPFLELPSFTFEVGDHEDEEDDSEEEEEESSY